MKIFLIGDSIRFGAASASKKLGCPAVAESPGYGIFVKEKLDGLAEVYAPGENCRFTEYTLRYLHAWAEQVPREEIDVVHWNNGAWDVLRLFGDEPLTPIDVYGEMLKRIYRRIRLMFPNAKVIFATTTPVIEEKAVPEFVRYNRDIEEYNKKAEEVLTELGVQINDLYTVAAEFDESLHSDWVHFGKQGSELLADAVVKACLMV